MAQQDYSERQAERMAERRERRIAERQRTMERREARAFKYGGMVAAR